MIEASSIIRIGGVSIDVSHPKAFASNLEKYCMNMRYALEYDDGFRTKQELEWFKNRYGLDGIAQSIEEMAGQVDVGFIQSCNWDKHLDQAMPFIREGKPVFIDKPIVGSSFLAIKTEAFCEQGEFRRNVDALIDEIKNVKLEAGTDEVLMPGEIEFRAESANRKKGGVPIQPFQISELNEQAAPFGFTFEEYL